MALLFEDDVDDEDLDFSFDASEGLASRRESNAGK